MKTIDFDVIIIGAGAAGLMCGIEAGKRGRSVLVVDHANKAGKKILMSGGGRCNFTNLYISKDNYISRNPKFCLSALNRYTAHDFIKLVEQYDIAFHEKSRGQLFCDNKSKDILNILLAECDRYNVTIQLNTTITNIKKNPTEGFNLTISNKNLSCQSLVIATGGLSIPTMGASPFGYQIAKQFGINVWPTKAGLVPFTLHPPDKERLAPLSGISSECRVSTQSMAFDESMLFTHRGLSGPAMLQISSYWQTDESLHVDMFPNDNLLDKLKQTHQTQPNSTLMQFFKSYLSKRQIDTWLEAKAQKKFNNLSHKDLKEISELFKNFTIKPSGTEGYRTAEVTLGGVDCNQISSKTFESNSVNGLYFIGEVLDVTGWLGGYNFQWAWSSGFCAGQFA